MKVYSIDKYSYISNQGVHSTKNIHKQALKVKQNVECQSKLEKTDPTIPVIRNQAVKQIPKIQEKDIQKVKANSAETPNQEWS